MSAKVRAHLSNLTALSDGSPNPRVTCTAGIGEAGKNLISVSLGFLLYKTLISDSPHTTSLIPSISSTADYIAGEMERIGLLPLGDMEGTSYFNIVPNSIHEQICPQGMRNIIGMIPGSDPALNDEHVIFSAHYDGPNNQNPQTEDDSW